MNDRSPRYLIVRVAGIGDVVLASTLLTRIRETEPDASVTWICGSVAAPLVERFAGVDEVITIDEYRVFRESLAARIAELSRLWRRTGLRRFDRVFLAHVDPRYRALVLPAIVAGSPLRVLQRGATTDPNPIPGRFFGDEYARLFDPPGNRGPIVEHRPLTPLRGLRPKDTKRRPLAVLVPGGAKNVLRDSSLRRWPVNSYAVLAEELIARGIDVEILGSESDAWVRPSFASIPVVDRIGSFTLVETVERMRDADVVVSHDTGPLHLARLAQAPLVAIFGPTPSSTFIKPDEATRVVSLDPPLPCQPCYDGREFAVCADNICMSSVRVDRVLDTALGLIGNSIS